MTNRGKTGVTEEKLLIFNIQKYSLNDGTGIRTIIFLKGCPLRCRWCCNPESQSFSPEIMYRKNLCIGDEECRFCEKTCPVRAISFPKETGSGRADWADRVYTEGEGRGNAGIAKIRFRSCVQCGRCAGVCPSEAIRTVGKWYTIREILQKAEEDSAFYRRGEGGVTLSGGEPLAHPHVVDLLREAKKRHLNTAVETCGAVERDTLLRAADCLDQIYFDIKSLNDERHREYTGISGERIRSNLAALCSSYPDKKITVRTPVIPGFNDSPDELERIRRFICELDSQTCDAGRRITWEKLPYHRYGVGKYEMLGRKYLLQDRQ